MHRKRRINNYCPNFILRHNLSVFAPLREKVLSGSGFVSRQDAMALSLRNAPHK
jgi:hypothetical protein